MPYSKNSTKIGIVIPCYNEEQVIPNLIEKLDSFIAKLSFDVRVLFVDDGSSDETLPLLKEKCESDSRYACISLTRNFGHQSALTAGLSHIEGDAVVVLDADLQDPVEVIPGMIEKWKEGCDVVYGIRKNRKENVFIRGAYWIFYRILKSIANVDLPLDAGDFSLMDRKVVEKINAMPEHNRFIRGLRGWVGLNQCGLPYERHARKQGKSKYNLSRMMKLAFDGIISFSSIPLRIASWIGSLAAFFGFIFLIYIIILALFFEETPSGWASLTVIVLFFTGVQLIVLGIIGGYIGRIFEEVKDRPLFLTSEKVGWVDNSTKEIGYKSVQ